MLDCFFSASKFPKVKAYVGLAEFLTEFKLHKGAELSELQLEWNEMLQFYRGRNEHLVAEIKNGRCLEEQWRHSYPLLCAVVRLVTHMVALQERMLGPRYDVFGPHPVCPDEIVSRYV